MSKPSTPFFSIIIPTYNRAHAISDAVNSVLRQTFKDFEVIIVDDGSTDNTAKVIGSFIEQNDTVKYVYQENAERSAARNHGIELAQGKYVCFLDSDDEYLPQHLENFHRKITSTNGNQFMIFCKATSDPTTLRADKWRYFGDSHTDQEFILLNTLTSQQVCIPRNVLQNQKYRPDFKIGEDRDLWMRLSASAPIAKINTATVWIKDLGDRTVDLKNLKSAKLNLKNLKVTIQEGGASISKKVRQKALSAGYFRLAQSYAVNHNRFKALYYAMLSLALFRDKYSKSVLVFIMNQLPFRKMLPNSIRS